jgi:hypothetical protein
LPHHSVSHFSFGDNLHRCLACFARPRCGRWQC